jgi:AraC-like DNA-binding protein
MKEDLSKLNSAYLEQMVNLFDDQFKAVDRLINTIGVDPKFFNVTNMKKDLSTGDRYEIWKMARNLDLFARSNSLVENIAVFARNPDLVIGESHVYYGVHMNIYTQMAYGIDATEYKNLMEVTYNQKIIRLNDYYPNNKGSNPLIYLQTLPIQFENNPKGALVITIDERNLEAFGKKELLPNGKVLVFNKDNQLIYTNDSDFYNMELPVEVLIKDKTKEVVINEIAFIKDTISTEYRNWSYISLVPKEIYYVRINEVRQVIFIMTFLFFLINILIAYYFTHRMYLPIKKIITTFSKEQSISSQSEYEYIENVINKNIMEQEVMKRDLFLQRQPLKNAFITKLLKGYVKDPNHIERMFSNYDIFINDEGFQILLIEISIEGEDQELISLSQFIVHNIFEEILSHYFGCQVVEIEGRLAFIINVDLTSIPLVELESHLETALNMVNDKYGLDCVIGVSNVHQCVISIADAYQESLEAIIHASILENRRIIYTQDLVKLSTQYEFSSEHEFRLIHYIKIGDLPQALSVIDEVIHKNVKNQQIKLGYLQCLMFDLMGAIIKSISNETISELINEQDSIRHMMMASSIDEMKKIIVDVVEIACEHNEINFQQNKKNHIEVEISSYIEDNYSDSDLNVSKLGQEFKMTPTYLSKIYKKGTGNSILYAINTVRIEASKKLLEETDLSINEISEKVGYLYCNAFIRFFKKQTGITPGQYKSLKKNNKL